MDQKKIEELSRENHKLFDIINEQKSQLHDLKTEKQLLLDNMLQGVIGIDSHGSIIFANKPALRMLDYIEDKLIKKNFNEVFLEEGQKLENGQIVLRKRGGEHLLVSLFGYDLNDEEGHPKEKLLIFKAASVEELQKIKASHDKLTGLPNHILLGDIIRRATERAKRNQDYFAVVVVDLDYFKNVNETLGYEVGDMLILEVSKRLEKILRGEDFIVRLGGDRFAIVLEGLIKPTMAAVTAGRILVSLEKSFYLKKHHFYISASIGIALYPKSGDTPELLLKHAKVAMKNVKQAGRCGYQFFIEEDSRESESYFNLHQDIRYAIERQEIVLRYVPQIDVRSKKVVGIEVAPGWQHPHHGFIDLHDLMTLAEATGMIASIGEWTLLAACKQYRQWLEEKIIDGGVKLMVSLSGKQLIYCNALETIKQAIEENHLKSSSLHFSISEIDVMSNIKMMSRYLTALSQLNVALCINKFGDTCCYLADLAKLPIQSIKVSPNIVSKLLDEDKIQTTLLGFVALAKQFGFSIMADGVVSAEQMEFLKKEGCYLIQGPYIGKPVTKAFMTKLLNAKH